MIITIVDTIKGVADAATIENVVKESIKYWGHYSGTAKLGAVEVEYRRNRANRDAVEIFVDECIPWS